VSGEPDPRRRSGGKAPWNLRKKTGKKGVGDGQKDKGEKRRTWGDRPKATGFQKRTRPDIEKRGHASGRKKPLQASPRSGEFLKKERRR